MLEARTAQQRTAVDCPTPQELVQRARDMIPTLRERARHCEQERRVPDETIEDFRKAGFFRILQPAIYGGYEMDPTVAYDVTIELARGCPSSAWVYGVVGVHQWEMALFPRQVTEEIWGKDTEVLLSSSYAPTGKIERAPGGYRLSGRWGFSSGCDHCDWVILGAGVVAPKEEGGLPDAIVVILPRSDYRIDDTWNVAGLCGTGSKDIVVDDVFVPEYRTHSVITPHADESVMAAGGLAETYKFPFPVVFGNAIATTSIGMALGALDVYLEQARKRVTLFDGAQVVNDPFAQHRGAAAQAAINGVRLQLEANFNEMRELIRSGQPVTVEHRARYRWDSANMARVCAQTVARLFEGMGGRALYLDNPMQRFFRDTHAATVHGFLNPEKLGVNLGRIQLGLDNQDFTV